MTLIRAFLTDKKIKLFVFLTFKNEISLYFQGGKKLYSAFNHKGVLYFSFTNWKQVNVLGDQNAEWIRGTTSLDWKLAH